MSYFKNAVCPVCRELLKEQDDVVVCPECGAPYHRACYKEAGRCLYEDKHGTGFSYLPDPEPEQKEETPQQVLCPRCHKSNPADAHACGNCGTPLAPSESEPFDPTPAYRRSRTDVHPDTEKFRPIGGGYIHFGFSTDDAQDELEPDDTLRAQLEAANIDSNETIDGFTLKEWLSYLGPSAPIYLFQFKQMDRSRHGRATIAIRENDIAAESSGVNVSNYKIKMFVISAFFAGIAGGIYAHQLGVLTAAKFDFNRSIDYLVMVVFGGMGSLTCSMVSRYSWGDLLSWHQPLH